MSFPQVKITPFYYPRSSGMGNQKFPPTMWNLTYDTLQSYNGKLSLDYDGIEAKPEIANMGQEMFERRRMLPKRNEPVAYTLNGVLGKLTL